MKQKLIHKDLEDRNLLQAKSLKLEKIMNEKMSKRRIQIKDLQKQEKNEIRPRITEIIYCCKSLRKPILLFVEFLKGLLEDRK